VKYQEYVPHPILQDTVKCFWTNEATYPSETTQHIPPDGCVELIFNFGNPYVLLTAGSPITLPTAVIVGLQNKTMRLRLHGTIKVVAARLFAWAALALLQDNFNKLTDKVTPLGLDWDTVVNRLAPAVTQGCYEQAVTTLQQFLMQKALMQCYNIKLIQSAVKLLHHTKGQCRIEDLADYCHKSVRQLQRGFQHVIGTSPKAFARTLHFESAQRRLMFHPETDLTVLTYECGYYDQAHFIKEFKAFTGQTPAEYAQAMRKMQEVLKSKDVVFLQSAAGTSG
jgi:AraC-like DNA-binding protein